MDLDTNSLLLKETEAKHHIIRNFKNMTPSTYTGNKVSKANQY